LGLEREGRSAGRERRSCFREKDGADFRENMNTQEVAMKLVELCRAGDFQQAVDSLYAQDIVSIEPQAMGDMPAEMKGLDKVRAKTEWWEKSHEVHSMEVSGPFVANDKFVVQFDIDVTDKNTNKRMQGGEVGIYTVKNGKVAREEFLPKVGDS